MISETVQVDTYFPPDDAPACLTRIVTEIDAAATEIYGIVYALTHDDIVQALVRALKRGVALYLILDMTEAHGKEVLQLHVLMLAGLQPMNIWIGTSEKHSLIHDKVFIIDGKTCIDGSLNYSPSGLKQNQNADVIVSEKRADAYKAQHLELRTFITATEPQYQAVLKAA